MSPRKGDFRPQWQPAEVKILCDGIAAGRTDAEISDELGGEERGRSVCSVMHKRYALRLGKTPKGRLHKCVNCETPVDADVTRCLRCHRRHIRKESPPAKPVTFSMVSKEEILEGGVRRRLYGDLRGI